jgi:hypothetical protein
LPFRCVPREGQYLPGIAPSRAPCGDGKIAGVIAHLISLQALSRDTDIVIATSATNLRRLRAALRRLRAVNIAVPSLSGRWLRKGHAVHFRCHLAGADGLCLDVMAHRRSHIAECIGRPWRNYRPWSGCLTHIILP